MEYRGEIEDYSPLVHKGRHKISMRKHLQSIGLFLSLFAAAYGLGTAIRVVIQQSVPEPEFCALHDLAGLHHAPALINLATGEIAELRVYEPNPTCPWEISKQQRTGYFMIYHGAGLTGYTDGGIATHVNLPQTSETIDNELFCRKCRIALSKKSKKGYVLLDLHELGNMELYTIAKGRQYEINGYTVSVEESEEQILSINVTGHLLDNKLTVK